MEPPDEVAVTHRTLPRARAPRCSRWASAVSACLPRSPPPPRSPRGAALAQGRRADLVVAAHVAAWDTELAVRLPAAAEAGATVGTVVGARNDVAIEDAAWHADPALVFSRDGRPVLWEREWGAGRLLYCTAALAASLPNTQEPAMAAAYVLARAAEHIARDVRPLSAATSVYRVDGETGTAWGVLAPSIAERAGRPVTLALPPGAWRDVWTGTAHTVAPDGLLTLDAIDGLAGPGLTGAPVAHDDSDITWPAVGCGIRTETATSRCLADSGIREAAVGCGIPTGNTRVASRGLVLGLLSRRSSSVRVPRTYALTVANRSARARAVGVIRYAPTAAGTMNVSA